MAKTYEVIGRLDRVVRTGYSYYGNPHHHIVVVTEDGDVLRGQTIVNGALGYGIKNGGVGETARLQKWTYHVTRNGNIMFDYVSKIEA